MTTDKLHQYSVWYDNQEQWDPARIPKPDLECRAPSALAAAKRLGNNSDATHVSVIVRDDETLTYRQIELTREWTVKLDTATTLDALCAP